MKKFIIFPIFFSIIFFFGMSFHSFYAAASTNEDNQKEKEVIVVYKNEKGKEKVIEQSGEVDHEFNVVPAVSASLTNGEIKKLEKDPNIDYIEENITFSTVGKNTFSFFNKMNSSNFYSLSTEQQGTYNYNIETVNAAQAWEDGFTGKGIKVAVLDSGIAPHKELKIKGGKSTVNYTRSWTDDDGHGTHVAGIIAAQPGIKKVNGIDVVGVAPNVDLYAVKVLNRWGEGDLTDILEGIEWAIENKMDIINMSFGTEKGSQLLQQMLNKAYNEGILLVSAAGNDGNNYPVTYPAKYDSVIAVSSVEKDLSLSDFSSTGDEVELAAPGGDIVSTYTRGRYELESGTSQAAPHVTGMLALLKEKYPTLTNKQLREKIREYTIDLGAEGKDSSFGYGLIQYKSDEDDSDYDEETLEKIEKAITLFSNADNSKKLWDYDSARNIISQLPNGSRKKAELESALKQLKEKLGLVEFTSISNVKSNQDFLITFSLKINVDSVNNENVFLRKEGEFVQGITYSFGKDGKTITIHAPEGGYTSKGTYFIYIDKTITGEKGKNLKFPVVVMFTVK